MEEALREVPAPSLNTTAKRSNGYHQSPLSLSGPMQSDPQTLSGVFGRFHSRPGPAKRIAEFRQVVYQLHEQGTELFVNTVLMALVDCR